MVIKWRPNFWVILLFANLHTVFPIVTVKRSDYDEFSFDSGKCSLASSSINKTCACINPSTFMSAEGRVADCSSPYQVSDDENSLDLSDDIRKTHLVRKKSDIKILKNIPAECGNRFSRVLVWDMDRNRRGLWRLLPNPTSKSFNIRKRKGTHVISVRRLNFTKWSGHVVMLKYCHCDTFSIIKFPGMIRYPLKDHEIYLPLSQGDGVRGLDFNMSLYEGNRTMLRDFNALKFLEKKRLMTMLIPIGVFIFLMLLIAHHATRKSEGFNLESKV